MDFDIKSMGAVPDGKTKNTEIIQKAIDMCSEEGGRVIIPRGVFMTGKLILKDNVELHITAGATLLGSPDYSDYPESELTHVDSKMLPRERNACLIFAEECKNISITGIGTIDANGKSYVVPKENAKPHCWAYQRIPTLTPPRVVFFTGCENVKIEDVRMINQPAGWSYWIHDCAFVTFHKIKIMADVRYPNNDGIHINCSHDVSISDSFITCGDDCIVLRANSISLPENKPCERVCVTNCTLTSYTNGVRVGWINDGVIRDCVFSNLSITDSRSGIEFKLPYRKRESLLLVSSPPKDNPTSTDVGREDTVIENLIFDNIIMDRMYSNPITFFIDERDYIRCNRINNIRFSNIHATGLKPPKFIGREQNHLGDIYFYNCSFTISDEVDGEKSKHEEIERVYAENLHFTNTFYTDLQLNKDKQILE